MKSVALATCLGLSLTALPVQGLAQISGQTRTSVAGGAAQQLINLPRGTSMGVELPSEAKDIVVSNPQVADAILHSARRITLLGLAGGETDVLFLDAGGRVILSLRVRVDAGTSALHDTLSRVVPGGRIHAEAVNDSIILTGNVNSPAEAQRAVQTARAFVSAPDKVINMIGVTGSDQVMLKVRVVEVQRSVLKQLGVSTDILRSNGIHSYGFGRGASFGVNGIQGGAGNICYGQQGTRTTDHSQSIQGSQNSANGINNSSSTNNSNNTSSGSSSSYSGNTTVTTSDGTTLNFNSLTPDSVTITDFAGNTRTLTGETAISAVRTALASGNVTSTVGTTASAALSQLISAVSGVTSSSNISNVVTNLASTAWKTATGTNANACLEAFERVGLVRTLAEPNLTSVNGEASSFLAGGEFPVPASRDRDGQVSVEYKPYGVALAFRPVVLDEGRINLQIKVEVSELTPNGGITLGAGTPQSVTLPGLSVRRTENTVEIPSGGAMMIAGLLQESTRQAVDSLPGLTNVAILGSLFRSRDYLMGETELVVIVEPLIVSPTSPESLQTPADGMRITDDATAIFFGQLNQAYGTPAPATSGAGWQGPVGYVIE